MVATHRRSESEVLEQVDQRVFLRGIKWWQYEALLSFRGEKSVPRMTYLEGDLELMSPSDDHERWKKVIARLVEAYADETDLDLNGYGSVTMKRAERERGAEPDESYVIGPKRGECVDLAIEVVKTAGGVDKLDVYRGLGVPEVWFYENGAFSLFRLEGGAYSRIERSVLLPSLDLDLVARFVEREDQTPAVREFKAALRERAGTKKRTKKRK